MRLRMVNFFLPHLEAVDVSSENPDKASRVYLCRLRVRQKEHVDVSGKTCSSFS